MSHITDPPVYQGRGRPDKRKDDKSSSSSSESSKSSKSSQREPEAGAETVYLTLAWMRTGIWNALVYQAEPGAVDGKKRGWGKIPDDTKPSYSIELGDGSMALYSGDLSLKKEGEQPNVAKMLIEIDPEGFFSTNSKYTDVESPVRRSVSMYRAKKGMGIEPDSLLSCTRTFDDFDGAKYKWKTTWSDNHKCIRLSDGAVVARFHFHQWSLRHLGDFTLHQVVNEQTLRTLLATCGMAYQLQRRRRRARNHDGE